MGEGIRFWTNYAEHIELAASLGLNAFRMGIEWARCQPSAVDGADRSAARGTRRRSITTPTWSSW